MIKKRNTKSRAVGIEKALTGIKGLDEITEGGLPKGRPTLICGSAGSGKTMLAMEFLVRGAVQYGEPGVFMAFEETPEDLAENVASMGFNLPSLIANKKLSVDYVHIEPSEIQETGEYDLEGLFIRLQCAVEAVGAKRVALDTIETLFSGLSNQMILRSEIRRLFHWLKNRGLTAVITAERGDGALTRQGLEEYVSDCVILLDNRVRDQISTRRLRIMKYRGTSHGANEYPFLIDKEGFSVLPASSMGLQHQASSQRVFTGIEGLDEILGGKGYYRGSTVLVSGTAGSGKTSVAAHFADATCRRGERCLYFAMEESFNQVARNMRGIGIDLKQWQEKGLLGFHAWRPSFYSLEMHLVTMHKFVDQFRPSAIVLDPITNLISVASSEAEVNSMLTRFTDFLKLKQITAIFTSLTAGGNVREESHAGISSLVDTWLLVRDVETNGERNRTLCIVKSRGMSHSNQVCEFIMTPHGVRLIPAYIGPGGVLTGTSRLAQEARDQEEKVKRQEEITHKRLSLETKRETMEAQIAALRAAFAAERVETGASIKDSEAAGRRAKTGRDRVARSRKADGEVSAEPSRESR